MPQPLSENCPFLMGRYITHWNFVIMLAHLILRSQNRNSQKSQTLVEVWSYQLIDFGHLKKQWEVSVGPAVFVLAVHTLSFSLCGTAIIRCTFPLFVLFTATYNKHLELHWLNCFSHFLAACFITQSINNERMFMWIPSRLPEKHYNNHRNWH